MNKSQRIGTLFFRYVRQELSEAEKRELKEWLAESVENEKYFREKTDPENIMAGLGRHFARDKAIAHDLENYYPLLQKRQAADPGPRILYIGMAAAIVLTMLSVFLFRPDQKAVNTNATVISPDEVARTMDDGHRGYLAGLAHIHFHWTPEGEAIYNADFQPENDPYIFYQIYRSDGERFSVRLNDTTRIWLNENTHIWYPANNFQKDLIIKFSGEIYCEISDTANSFYHFTDGRMTITTSLLGMIVDKSKAPEPLISKISTAMDIKCDTISHSLIITMIRGAAYVQPWNTLYPSPSPLMLYAGQQYLYDTNGIKIINTASPDKIIAWKNRPFKN